MENNKSETKFLYIRVSPKEKEILIDNLSDSPFKDYSSYIRYKAIHEPYQLKKGNN